MKESTKGITRREFLVAAAQGGAVLAGVGLVRWIGKGQAAAAPVSLKKRGNREILSVAKGKIIGRGTKEAEQLLRACLEPLGGIQTFVKPGERVVVKPCASWMRTPEQAANTNPLLVGALVSLCLKAGAARVTVFDHTCDTPSDLAFEISGITEATRAAGGILVSGHEARAYQQIKLPRGRVLTSAAVHGAITDADVLIDVPVAKVHNATGATVGMKNLMGIVWNRVAWHSSPSLDQCIVDFASAVTPTLTIVDASRVLLTNGPKGPGETKALHTIAASADIVAADSYGAELLGLDPERLRHIRAAAEMRLGQADLTRMKVVHASA
jgi:uncharacterized protein (DUF362 family)